MLNNVCFKKNYITVLLLWFVQIFLKQMLLKSVHLKKPVTPSSFLSKSVAIFKITTTNMTTLFERNEDRVTDFSRSNVFGKKIS